MLHKPAMGSAAFASAAMFFAAILITAVPVLNRGGVPV